MDERNGKIQQEYERLRGIFEGAAPEQLELLDGMFREAARIRAELDEYAELVGKSGRIRYNPKNPRQQEVLLVSREMEKTRAAYTNIMFKLSRALGTGNAEEILTGLEDYV